MENCLTSLLEDDTFAFACSPQVACFNACCRDLNQFLTPYDILRMKKALKMTSGQFLAEYTRQHIGPETGLPVITLKPRSNELACPFVTDAGCRVYDDRPSSCRSYPLARIAGRDRASGRLVQRYVLLKEPHCRGFEAARPLTIAAWIEAQGLTPYNQMNDLMMDVITLKRRHRPGPLPLAARQLFHLACYDVDGFKKKFFEQDLAQSLALDDATQAQLRENDEALLQTGLAWIKLRLFCRPENSR